MNVYILRTHFWNDYVNETYEKLVNAFGVNAVYVLYDVTTKPHEITNAYLLSKTHMYAPNETLEDNRVLLYVESMCSEINALHNITNTQPHEIGSFFRCESFITLLHRSLRDVDFRYMWIMEYDVYCHGNIQIPFEWSNAIEADFMAKGSDLSPDIRCGTTHSWCWWSNLVGEFSQLPLSHRYGCFFPLTRYSKAFLDVIEKNLGVSSGFCEVYIPTLCVFNDLMYKGIPADAFGEFTFFDPKTVHEIKQKCMISNQWYHPVKS
jgi:hypothetical protein